MLQDTAAGTKIGTPFSQEIRAAIEAVEPQWFLMLELDEPAGMA
ncbi:MAG: hypothetical protein OIN88_16175 [Candidatus Methanoperedens sp.]|nr:hypothetical protein [Candidatus Methanoperedens sp.]MCZ7358620.1 hypothetical protein [Candidatus Methanoperedens sp.]